MYGAAVDLPPHRRHWGSEPYLFLQRGGGAAPQYLQRFYPGTARPFQWTGVQSFAMRFEPSYALQLWAFACNKGWRVFEWRSGGITAFSPYTEAVVDVVG